MFCQNCGNQIPEGAAFCGACGAAVAAQSAAEPVVPPVSAEPVDPQPVYTEPVDQQPVYTEPVDQQPSYQQPIPPVQPAQQATMFCPACGAKIPVGLAVCTNCGTSLGSANRVVGGAPANGAQKSKLTAGLLGIFLGGFGVHNFYLGYTGKAIGQIALTVFCLGAGGIWGLIEGIMILTGSINKDANGVPLGD